MAHALKSSEITVEDYLALDDASEGKSEWIYGQILAMAGAGPRHNTVNANLTGFVLGRLRNTDCRGELSDQRVHCAVTGHYYYPDFTIVCGPREYTEDGLSLVNPRVLFEVSSPSTTMIDGGTKLFLYARIPSLTDYIIIDPTEQTVSHFRRRPDGWLLSTVTGDTLTLEHPAVSIPLAELFRDVDGLPK